MADKQQIRPAAGKLGVLTPGMGAVASTFIAGVVAIRKGLRLPIGSLTQMGHIRLGKRTDDRQPLVRNFVPLADLDQLVFGGWDIFEDDVYQAAMKAGVLEKDLLNELKDELEAIKPMKAVFDNHYVKKLHGTHVKTGKSKMDLAEQVMADMETFKKVNGVDRLVMIWCGSTEIFMKRSPVHADLASFEQGLRDSHADIPP
ncbi:MAG TPA: inositol-3-phosphate synthase, partial [Candidatus Krumholzibacteria bacterium]|nr:inositol-3-phosphate synthase [Candidatus Krumholzibacteria bacterium]